MRGPAAGVLVLLALLSGCGPDGGARATLGDPTAHARASDGAGARRWAPPALPSLYGGISMCGFAYIVQVDGRTLNVGDCMGLIPKRLIDPVVVDRGAVIYVQITHETDGTLDYPVPEPNAGAVVRTARRGYIARYRAAESGTTYLVAHRTMFCEGIDPQRGSCRVLQIRVR